MDYLSEVAQQPIGWTPVVGLLLSAITAMVVVRVLLSLWRLRPKPVRLNELREVVVPTSRPYWPAQRPAPVLVGIPFAPPVVEGTASVVARAVAVAEAPQRALVTDTAEFVIVWDDQAGELVSDEPLPTEPANLPALREDELGAWDPNTVDWLEPAVYVEALEFSIRRRPSMLSDTDRAYLAYALRREALVLADAVMTGA